MEVVLPVKVGDAVGGLFVFVVADEEEVIELLGDRFLEVVYFLRSEQPVICILFYGENLGEEVFDVFLSILDRLHSDLKAEFFALPFQSGQSFLLLLESPALLLSTPLLDYLLEFPAFFLLQHIIEFYLLVLCVFLHLLNQLFLYLGVEELLDLLQFLGLLADDEHFW